MPLRFVLALIACLLIAAPAAQAALPRGFVGLYGDDAFFGSPSYRQAQLGMESRVGVETVRQPLEWSRVERSPGVYDFSAYDPFVADAAAAGLTVLPVLVGPPDFRSSRPPSSASHAMYPPRSNAAYAEFVAAAVRRYGPEGSFWRRHPSLPFIPVRSWQVWNEPNIPNFWRSGVDARAYVALLRAGSSAIRAVDPSAEVVAAGLPNSNLGVPFLTYLDRMYRSGARGLFDTLAIHPYSHDVPGLLALAESARALMNRWHDRSRLWITEFGWSTGGGASAFRVSERGQANRIAEALSALVAERRALRLRGFVFFKWRDSVPPVTAETDPWPLHTGLLEAAGQPKRGFWVFGRVVKALREGAGPGTALTGVSRRSVRLSPLGFAAVALGCSSPQTAACGGRLRLRSARTVSCGGETLAAGSALGGTTFTIAVAPALAPVRVPAVAARVIRCAGAVRVRATVSQPATAPGAVEFVLRGR
ncbi:MAG: polysaccharide biosynthesis protein PslG [Thermoleophilaceae bacterium]|nr:polysaccharide biosynthesis protein PslG [Thermoleophilaceae bacterium]